MATDDKLNANAPESNDGITDVTEVQEKGQQDRSKLAVDLVAERTRTIADEIEEIDSEKFLDEQAEAKASLEIVLKATILNTLKTGIASEEITKDPHSLAEHVKDGDTAQKAAAKKLSELMSISGATLDSHTKWWLDFSKNAAEEFKKVVKAKDDMEAGKKPKNTEWMGTAGTVACLAIGAFGLYKLASHFSQKKEERTTSSLAWAGAITTIGVGSYIAKEGIAMWIAKNMGLSLTDKAMMDMVSSFKQWKFFKGLSFLRFKNQQPEITEASEKWDIPESFIIDVNDHNYGKFKESLEEDSRMSYAAMALELAGVINKDTNIPGTNVDDQLKYSTYGKTLVEKIEENKYRLEGNVDDKKIGDILVELKNKGAFSESASKEDEAPAGEKPNAEPGSLQDHAGKFPNAWGAYEKWKAGGYPNTMEALGDFIDKAVTEDHCGIAFKDGALYVIASTGETALVTNSAVLAGGTEDLVRAMTLQEGSWENLAKYPLNFIDRGGGWWIGAGAVAGYAASFTKSGYTWKSGAARGIVEAHIFFPKTVGQIAVGGSTEWKLLNLSRKAVESLSPEAKMVYERALSLFHAERYEYYYKLYRDTKKHDMTGGLRGKLYKFMAPEWLAKRLDKHGRGYIEARDAMFETAGKTGSKVEVPRIVDLTEFADNPHEVRGKLLDDIAGFRRALPESKMPKLPEYIFKASTEYETHRQATSAGLKELSSAQIERMTRLGMSERLQIRIREWKFKPDQLEEVIKAYESGGADRKAIERLMWSVKHAKAIKAFKVTAKAAGLLAIAHSSAGFEDSDDKSNYILENANMFTLFTVGFKGSYMAVGSKVPNPIAGAIGSAVVGVGTAMGGGAIYDETVEPYLAVNYPNRRKFWDTAGGEVAGNTLTMFGGFVFNTAEYAGVAAGLWGELDETVDPLKHLQYKLKFVHYNWITKGLEDGKLYKPLDNHSVHDWGEMVAEAGVKIGKYEIELASLDEKNDSIRIKELKAGIKTLKRVEDGSWVLRKKAELAMQKMLVLEPAYDEIGYLVKAKHGDEGFAVYEKLWKEAQETGKRPHIDEGNETQVWQFLAPLSVEIGEGTDKREVSFLDMFALSIGLKYDMDCLEVLEKQHPEIVPQASAAME